MRDSRCNDRPHSPAKVEFRLLRMRPTCSIVTVGWVAFGMNWSNTESTTTRTDKDSTNGGLNASTHPIRYSPPRHSSVQTHVPFHGPSLFLLFLRQIISRRHLLLRGNPRPQTVW